MSQSEFVQLVPEHFEVAGRACNELFNLADRHDRQLALACMVLYMCHTGDHVPEDLIAHLGMNMGTLMQDEPTLRKIINNMHAAASSTQFFVPKSQIN